MSNKSFSIIIITLSVFFWINELNAQLDKKKDGNLISTPKEKDSIKIIFPEEISELPVNVSNWETRIRGKADCINCREISTYNAGKLSSEKYGECLAWFEIVISKTKAYMKISDRGDEITGHQVYKGVLDLRAKDGNCFQMPIQLLDWFGGIAFSLTGKQYRDFIEFLRNSKSEIKGVIQDNASSEFIFYFYTMGFEEAYSNLK